MHELKFLAIGVIAGGALGFAFYTKAALELSKLKAAVKEEARHLEAQVSAAGSYASVYAKEHVAALRRLI